jgi:hypothetical protein
LKLQQLFRVSNFNPAGIVLTAFFILFFSIASVDTMHDIEVEYVTFPGWRGRSTSECRTFNSLPHNARLYVQFIEQYLGVPGLFFFFFFSYMIFISIFLL